MAFTCRTARRAELADCTLVWYSAVDDYMARLGRPLPSPRLDPLLALMDHLLLTDPDRFLVAVKPAPPGLPQGRPELVVGFGIAVQREHVWFLSQLYVLPSEQHHGIGRTLLSRLMPPLPADRAAAAQLPPRVLATCTDTVQPTSTGLYSRFGMVPRVPIINLVGTPKTPSTLAPLPAGVHAEDLSRTDATAAVDAIDRAVLGYAHQVDHAHLRSGGRTGFLYVAADGAPVGYGYSSDAGRFGPVAVLDATLTEPVLGHLMSAIKPRGATTVWVPGDNDRAMIALLRAGLRVEGFPAMIAWTQPFAAFDRYIPAGLALL